MMRLGVELVGYETASLCYGYRWKHEPNGNHRSNTMRVGIRKGFLKLDYVQNITFVKESPLDHTSFV